jgi:hypothetical protein
MGSRKEVLSVKFQVRSESQWRSEGTMFAKISESDFNKIDPMFRIIIHDYSRSFGSLHLPNASHDLTLCWRSDMIDPVIVSDPVSSTLWIGVDQRVICVSLQGNVLFSLGLSTFFFDIKLFDEFIMVQCETELIAVNRDYSIRKIYDLREISAEVYIKDNQLVVTFIDGEKEVFSI